jgi:hypothetical protein
MGSYLQNYGAGEEQRNKAIKWIIISAVSVVLISWFSYLFLHNFFEEQTVKRFLSEVNSRDYQAAYRDFGCTDTTPCPNYDYKRFLEDWGPEKKAQSAWKVDSVEGCTAFVTVNVKAQGRELESLGVLRGGKTVMFAPASECQERTWKWGQFFHRIFGGGSQS